MSIEIKMPQLSDTMDSGKILGWKKSEGEAVKRGDILAEVETDKANLEIEAFHEGVLLKIAVPAQEVAQVGQVIAYIGQAGESVTASSTTTAPQPQPVAPPAAAPQSTAAMGTVHQLSEAASLQSGRIKASPLARKIAEEKQIDLSAVHGSGPQGRIVRKDIEELRPATQEPGHASIRKMTAFLGTPAAHQDGAISTTGGTLHPLSKMRETIARRMQESVQQSPHFFSTVSINMREALRLKSALKEEGLQTDISLNHIIIKAVAYALTHEPRVNCAMREGQLFEPEQINIGIITAIENGLLIPVIREANRLSLADLAFEARAAVERARAGRPNSTDLSGGTFCISNMGMFDVENFTAIINPGQGAVLAVSAVRESPVVENGQVVPAPMMKVTLSVDHRVIDGVMAATFLKFFKRGLELPALLMA